MELDYCPLTGWEIEKNEFNPYRIGRYCYYNVENQSKEYWFLLDIELINRKDSLTDKQYVFRWLIFQNLFSHNLINVKFDSIKNEPDKYKIDEEIYNYYIYNYSNISPKEKLDHLLITLSEMCNDSFRVICNYEKINFNTAFKSKDEFKLYVNELVNSKLITHYSCDFVFDAQLSFQAILEVERIKESGKNSKRCFVAMSFDPSLKETREAIRNGIKEAGYDAVFIDEVNPVSDQTINDAIIAEIKRSKFLVADFTQQKNGVYFEAGYALGRGLKVIYCCEEKDFAKSHFDLKPFSHILYNSTEELQKRLKYKIEAWIE